MARMYHQIRCGGESARRAGRSVLRETLRNSIIAAAMAGMLSWAALPVAAQATISRGPRTADGKPNLNGIWQVLTEANWDLQGHAAAAGPMIPLGAIGAMPPGQGVVEGE